MATSIVQGGSGLPILMPAAYRYICYNEFNGEEIDIIPDPLIKKIVDLVSYKLYRYLANIK